MVQTTRQAAANRLAARRPARQAEDLRASAVAGGKVTDAGEGMVANPNTPPIVAQPGQAIPQGPELHQVQAGDLITAQFINDVVLAVQNLQERVADLEALLDDTSDTSAPTI